MSTEVKILFFGKARELVTVDEARITVPTKVKNEDLKRIIFREVFQVLASMEDSCILAVDQRYVDTEEELTFVSSSEIAIIPPLSGG